MSLQQTGQPQNSQLVVGGSDVSTTNPVPVQGVGPTTPGSSTSIVDASSADTLTCGGTATGTAALLLTTWVANTTYATNQVRRTAGGLVIKYTGPGTSLSSGSGPTTVGTGTDGTAPYVAYLGTGFGGILVQDADGANALWDGKGSQITAGGDMSGSFVASQAGMTWPRGTDVTQLYAITGGSSVNYTVALTL